MHLRVLENTALALVKLPFCAATRRFLTAIVTDLLRTASNNNINETVHDIKCKGFINLVNFDDIVNVDV